jgi:hypothetical protein
MPPDKMRIKLITLFLFFALCAFSIARFLSNLGITPDSSGYITAAQNFIRTGHMFAYANSPSWSLEPAVEPYTEQPSGFPLFLVPFLLIFRQPILAAAVAQALAILILYSAVYALTQDLGAGPFFQIVCAVAFTLFRPMQYVYIYVISETLFIALSLWSIHFLVATQFSQRFRLNWITALVFAAAASLTRAVGVLMLGVFIWVAWRRQKSRWISIALSVLFVVGPMIAWSLRNQILYGSLSMTHEVINHIAWEKLFPQLVFLLDSASRNAFVVTLFAVFVVLCLAAPFIGPIYPWIGELRFRMDFSKGRFFNVLCTVLGLVVAVIALAADRLGFGGDPEIGLKQIAIASAGILIALAPWLRNTNLLEYVRSWKAHYDWNRWKTRPFFTFALLFLGGLSHFWGITALSLVTTFSALTDRLLAPSLAILLFAGLAGMHYLTNMVPTRYDAAATYTVAFSLILLSPFFLKTDLAFHVGIRIPPEQQLWKEIYNFPGINKASHFYSDYNFTHEIFANRPQRIILIEDQIEKEGFLHSIMARGQCPFVLVNQGDHMSQLMNQHYQEADLIRLEMMDGQFELFAQPCLFSP